MFGVRAQVFKFLGADIGLVFSFMWGLCPQLFLDNFSVCNNFGFRLGPVRLSRTSAREGLFL